MVPIYPTSSTEQVEWILGDSGAIAIVAGPTSTPRRSTRARAELPECKHCG